MIPARTGEGSNDGLIVAMNGTVVDIINVFLNLGEGCVVSQTPRMGIYCNNGGYININGSEAKPVILYNCHSDAVWNSSSATAPTQASICEVNNCIINSPDNGGLKEQENNGRGFIKSVTNTIITNTKMPGIELYSKGALPPIGGVTSTVTVDNVTLHNCGYDPGTSANYDFRGACIASPSYMTTNQSNRNVVITNTIISGSGLTGIYSSGSGSYNIDYSALVTQLFTGHTYALGVETAGPGTIIKGTNVINSSPMYVAFDVLDFDSPDFMDVDNPFFAGKGTSGSDLAGGADFIGGWLPPAAANAFWALYE
jgi:hypothetical protein